MTSSSAQRTTDAQAKLINHCAGLSEVVWNATCSQPTSVMATCSRIATPAAAHSHRFANSPLNAEAVHQPSRVREFRYQLRQLHAVSAHLGSTSSTTLA